MTPLNERYRVVEDKKIIITWCPDGRETVDWLIGPDDGELSFDGKNIIYHPPAKWRHNTPENITTFMQNGFIEDFEERGYLEKVQ